MNKTLKDCYEDGYAAFHKSDSKGNYKYLRTNPLRKNTVQYKEWERGYNCAYKDNLERMQQREQNRARS